MISRSRCMGNLCPSGAPEEQLPVRGDCFELTGKVVWIYYSYSEAFEGRLILWICPNRLHVSQDIYSHHISILFTFSLFGIVPFCWPTWQKESHRQDEGKFHLQGPPAQAALHPSSFSKTRPLFLLTGQPWHPDKLLQTLSKGQLISLLLGKKRAGLRRLPGCGALWSPAVGVPDCFNRADAVHGSLQVGVWQGKMEMRKRALTNGLCCSLGNWGNVSQHPLL